VVDGEFKLTDCPFPEPGKGQVLIKVSYSTMKPKNRDDFNGPRVEG
jgi:NADPH-dependent curcumin reductase CurA